MKIFRYTEQNIIGAVGPNSFGAYLTGYIAEEIDRGHPITWEVIEMAFDAYQGGAR